MSVFEKPDENVIPKNQENQKKRKFDATFTRHSVSSYKTGMKMITSEQPTQKFNPNEQITPDLPEKGMELAKQEAEKFFADFNPQEDALFFASSNQARAVETANIYRQIAHERGFEILKPEHARGKISDEIANGEIRIVHNLSIPERDSHIVIESVFALPGARSPVKWDSVNDPDLKRRFDEASAIIEADNRGSFGANYLAHSDKVKEIFPEIKTAEELSEIQFKNLLKLLKFGHEKSQKEKPNKNVKILAFGHENYLLHALEKYFHEEGIKNCETIYLNVENDAVQAEFRGKNVNLGS